MNQAPVHTRQAIRWPIRFSKEMEKKYGSVWPNKNLLDCIAEYMNTRGDEVGVVDRGARYTFHEIVMKAERFAHWMQSQGLQSGDVVSFQLPNWHEAIVVTIACSMIGAVVNPVVPIYRERELEYILKDAETKLLVIPGLFRGFDYSRMVSELRNKPPLVVCCDASEQRFVTFDQIQSDHIGKKPQYFPIHPNALAYILYTSGTESSPKGVEHTQNVLIYDLQNTIENNRITEKDVLFGASPVTHITGLIYYILLPFVRGVRVCLFDVWNPGEAVRLIEQERCTWTVGATPFLQDLLFHSVEGKHDISSIRAFRCGGADVPPSLIIEANRRGINTYRAYGCTEHPTISGLLFDSTDPDFKRQSMTDGRIHSGIELRCVNPDDTNIDMAVGEVGEILTRGPDLSMGYHNEKLNMVAFDADGWFRTGDLGFVDREGFITITGRKKDIIIRKGENISTKEIEDIISSHAGIREVAVVGIPDEERGEKICAVVVPVEGFEFTFSDLVDLFKGSKVAKQKIPEQLEIRQSLPKTASGKIRKSEIRDELSNKSHAA